MITKRTLNKDKIVKCLLCGYEAYNLNMHLKFVHSTNGMDYKKQFPGALVVNKISSTASQENMHKKVMEKYGVPVATMHDSIKSKISSTLVTTNNALTPEQYEKKYHSCHPKGVSRTFEDVEKIKLGIQKSFENGRVQWSKGKHWDEILGEERYNEIAERKKNTLQTTLKRKRIEGFYKLSKPVQNRRGYGGLRKDLGFYVRSRYEANICRILNYFNISFLYEKKHFSLSNNWIYTPDLFLTDYQVHVEIKGYMSEGDLEKINTFVSLYPNEILYLIDYKQYYLIEYICKDIVPNWELVKDMSYLNIIRRSNQILRDYTPNREDIVHLLLSNKIIS